MVNSIKDDAALPLQAVKCLAQYLSASTGPDGTSQRAAAISKADALVGTLAESDAVGASVVQAVAGIMHIHEEKYEAALRCVRSGNSLELLALHAQILLRLDRADLAEKQCKLMQEKDDESCLTQLTQAAVCLALGGVRAKEAGLLYKDMLDRYGETVPVLNGAAVACMAQRQYTDAAKYLQDALAKAPNDADTLANLAAVSQHLGKVAEGAQYAEKLRRASPGHAFSQGWARVEASFDRVAAQFA